MKHVQFYRFIGTEKVKLILRNSRADNYTKWGPQLLDCYGDKNAVFHQGIMTMITIPTVYFKPKSNN